MHWYGGSIAEAVTLSKQRNAIFVVFVEGDNELSVEMSGTIENSAVVKRLSNEGNFLAIKLKSGTVNYTHFAQIYQFVPVPSLFFIGRNGTPLEVVCAGVQADNLATRIDRILEEHQKSNNSSVHTVLPSTSSQSVKEQTASLLQAESASVPPTSAKNPQSSIVMPALAVNQPTITGNVPVAVEKSINTPSSSEKTITTATLPASAENVPGAAVDAPLSTEKVVSDDKSSTSTVTNVPDYQTDLISPAAKVQKTEQNEDKSGQHEIVCDGDVCIRRPKAGDPGPSTRPISQTIIEAAVEPSSSADSTMEEKLDHAKVLIEARRREKSEKEKETEKQKELERRATGQDVTELKRWQHEQELKQIQEERKREKMENNLARQRILEQIAQDRAERKAREQPQPTQPSPTTQQPTATAGDGGARTRLQFKLPDGASHTAHFAADDTLSAVRTHLATDLQLPSENFSLWTAFPRRELTQTDATLRELQLAPSAALLVLPRRIPPTVAQPSTMSNVIAFFTTLFTTLVLNPTHQLYEWISNFLSRPPAPRSTPTREPQSPRAPPSLRRRGNIHRLPGDAGTDDDNNTWNGNSTQQM